MFPLILLAGAVLAAAVFSSKKNAEPEQIALVRAALNSRNPEQMRQAATRLRDGGFKESASQLETAAIFLQEGVSEEDVIRQLRAGKDPALMLAAAARFRTMGFIEAAVTLEKMAAEARR